jgi:hypothetical protein
MLEFIVISFQLEEQDSVILDDESDYFEASEELDGSDVSENGDKVDSGVSTTTRSGRTVKPVERYGLITHAPRRERVKIPNSYKEQWIPRKRRSGSMRWTQKCNQWQIYILMS